MKMLFLTCVWFTCLCIVVYILFKITLIRSFAKTLLNGFLAWDTNRLAKLKSRDKQNDTIKKDLFDSMGEVIQAIGGPVLEIGAGSGSNLKYYPENTRLITIDLNEHFWPYLDENLKTHDHVKLEKYLLGNAEDMKGIVEDNSCSCVVSSLLLCCVDQEKTLSEIRRVLKPGGRLYFIEHIIEEPGTWTHWFQLAFTPIWKSLRSNCHLDRTTDKSIMNFNGFVDLQAYITYRNLPLCYFFAKRTYIGYVDTEISKG